MDFRRISRVLCTRGVHRPLSLVQRRLVLPLLDPARLHLTACPSLGAGLRGLRVLGLLGLAQCSLLANDPWTRADTMREVSWQLINVADWSQTRQFEHTGCDGKYNSQSYSYHNERNPMVGRNPSQGRINTACLAAALLHLGVSMALPPGGRCQFQVVTIVLSASAVTYNYHLGIKIKF